MRASWFCGTSIIVIVFAALGTVSRATQPTARNKTPDYITAPIRYDVGLMLVMASEREVAAVVFTGVDNGLVKYRYRLLSGRGKQKIGDGKVFEKYTEVPITTRPGENRLVDEGSRLFIRAGFLNLRWSRSTDKCGYVYYRPEDICVQIADADDFGTIDLGRFRQRPTTGDRSQNEVLPKQRP